ncbi:unnamed protein product [Zymoseptoria tritici ST99CH_3D7]|uniref:P450 monooxygenase n=1 Tax=Zymoseptoria tritici (strain ST99CH_3D7) TaxID=1276538 RepID=A0A1X7REA8_ZYMT9|nr:unnamed protein product [Zymoseptoria tritici ST99CH_3D7]
MPLASADIYNIAWCAGILLAGYLLLTLLGNPFVSSQDKFLDSHTCLGQNKQCFFSRFRADLASVFQSSALAREGYEKFSKMGKNWVMPQFCADRVIVLPAQKLQEVMSLDDDQIDHLGPLNDAFIPKYTTGIDVLNGPHVDIVRQKLTRRLPLMTADVYEELVLAMERVWAPKQDEWTTVKVLESTMKIVGQAANRMLCGPELCRNPVWLEATRRHAITAFATGFMLRPFPGWTHPITGRIAAIPHLLSLRKCKRMCTPIIEERLRNTLDPTTTKTSEAPFDLLQWIVEDTIQCAQAESKTIDMDMIVRQLLILIVAAIHTTTIMTTHTLLDLYSHPDANTYVEGLREECERVFAESGGKWTKVAVDKLIRVDSTIRESMRLYPFVDLSLRRTILPPAGVTLSDGTHIPQGVTLGFTGPFIHRDPTFYPENPEDWDGFRFSRPRERGIKADLETILEQKNTAMTAVQVDFLTFGLGRHACPGRFFASQEMKLMLAHIVMNYDVRVAGGKRPPTANIAGNYLPDESAKLEIKLRER